MAWYPRDTGLFITGSFDKTVKVWDTNAEQVALNFDLDDHVYGVGVQSASSAHSLLAVACGDQRVILCDLATGGRKHTLLGHRGPVHVVSWSTCEEFVLATGGSDGTVRLWDIRRTHTCRAILNQDGPPHLLSGSGAHRKRQREEAGAGAGGVPQAHSGGVSGLLFSPHGRHLLSSGADGRMRSWHPMTCEMYIVNYGAFPQTSQANYKRVQFAASWNANLVYHPRRNDLIVCDLESGERLSCLSAHMATVYCCVAQVLLILLIPTLSLTSSSKFIAVCTCLLTRLARHDGSREPTSSSREAGTATWSFGIRPCLRLRLARTTCKMHGVTKTESKKG